jgi:para-aminobenzoate synthetase component 1
MRGMSGRQSVRAEVATLPRALDPLALFRLLERDPHPVLLHSAREDADAGRFSLVASDPFLLFRHRGARGLVTSLRREAPVEGDPFETLRACLDRHRVDRIPGVPFAGGAIGYLGYPLRRWIHPPGPVQVEPSAQPDLILAFYGHAFVVDHVRGCTHLVATGLPEETDARRRQRRMLDAARLIERAESLPRRESPEGLPSGGAPEFATSRARYLDSIERARRAIAAGEIYQVNLSHRVRVPGSWRPFELYRALSRMHPAAFSAFLPYPEFAVLCASPERLVRLEGRRAETRPIKGTRRRDPDPAADRKVARDLAGAPKERSENVMIVDLARNDLGMVCETGSVRVEEICRVETLPTVHHLVSTIRGILREDRDRVDLVRALFPGGSMTGAPKIRAMQIIDEIERVERGIYSGCVGYFSFDGDLDLNIVIRSLVLAGGAAHLQVGGAILAESDPEAEYRETLDKAGPLLDLLGGAART